MTHDPESTLRPLRQRASDVDALRAGASAAALVVRVARAAESTLRRMLRDDLTAPVDLRLRALSEDDLPTPDLLAELRRRNRLPMELAAAFHDLDLAAERIAGGADPSPRDAPLAVSVADGLVAHVLSHPGETILQDPVRAEYDEPALGGDEEDLVHPVPSPRRRRVSWEALAALAVLLVLLLVAIRLRGGDDGLRRGEAALAAGRVAEAERELRAYADDHPDEPQPHVYLARIYRQGGRVSEAEREIQAGLRAAPEDPGLLAEQGYLLLDTGRPAEAVPVFRRAVLADRESRRAWAGLVGALRASGRAMDADQVLRQAPADLRPRLRAPVDTSAVP